MPSIRELKRQRAEQLNLQKSLEDRVDSLEIALGEVQTALAEIKEKMKPVEEVDDNEKEPKVTKTSSRTTSK